MKKDLKEAILGIEVTQFDGQKADLEELVNPKQLEKIISDWMPEALSLEWVDEYAQGDYDEWVYTEDLQNLLVPKQELPVIPKFVAEWIEELKQDERPLYSVMSSLMNKTNHEWAVWKSANKNFSEIVAQAWLDGYEVAEEQKYRVILEENSYGAMGLGIGREGRLTFTATHDKWSLPKLTEQEIKDYDERFWPFAVKVEELEE